MTSIRTSEQELFAKGGDMSNLGVNAWDGTRELRRGWHALVALAVVVVGSAACDGASPTPPATPGSISVSTETSGFMKDDSYELLVDGASQGTIGANDQVTISDLDPADYDLSLGDVASNCSVQTASVPVEAAETAEVLLSVVCAPPEPVSYQIRFSRERPDLDTGEITECPFGFCDSNEAWDIYAENDSNSDPHTIIHQNESTGVEIAHLPGVTLDDLTEEDYDGATFTTEPVSEPFDSGRVILVRTDLGNVYALGNPVEDTESITTTLTFDAVLIVESS